MCLDLNHKDLILKRGKRTFLLDKIELGFCLFDLILGQFLSVSLDVLQLTL